MDIKEHRTRVNSLLADLRLARGMEQQAAAEASQHFGALETSQNALAVVQAVAQTVQQRAHSKICAVVTRSLRCVFGEEYEFKIDFVRKRGKTEAVLSVVKDGNEIDPMTGSGGGVVDVAAFALRCAALVMSKPRRRRVLLLDEPMKFVSENYRPAVRAMIESLAEELQVQFIIVTHDEALMMGKIVRI